VLPPLDDDLARSASEFETLADLRADIESRLREQIEDEVETRFRADVARRPRRRLEVRGRRAARRGAHARAAERLCPAGREQRRPARDVPRDDGQQPEELVARLRTRRSGR
jgi:FKBP-type peptidyl-prolyl cis-trans isomerase (trigger factor)